MEWQLDLSVLRLWELPFIKTVLHGGWDTLQHARVADFFDILAIATLIYLGLLWFRYARAVRVAGGILFLGIVYLLASHTGMILTTAFFRSFFLVFMLSLVSIFQEDLRRFFEKLSLWHWRPGDFQFHLDIIDPLTRVLIHFSESRIGALVILKGYDPLDRHLEGGHALGGKVSAPLLESLFDPHSDGHDGAIIVEGDRVTRFGVHLPLSHHLDKDSGFGTRHAAALGLSEVCDALCLVVSEQKGTISVAQLGRLTTVAPRRLTTVLQTFLTEKKIIETVKQRPISLLFRHPWERSISLILGIGLWLVFAQGFKPVRQTLDIPVHVQNVPAQLKLKTLSPSEVAVTLGGLQRDFSQLDSLRLGAYADFEGMEKGKGDLEITTENLNIPESLRLISVDPSSIDYELVPKPTSPKVPRSRTKTSSHSSHSRNRWFFF